MSIETIKAQVQVELAYHQQETVRLQKILELLGGQGVPAPAPPAGLVGTARDFPSVPLKVYKKRTQSPESRARIGAYQKERHRKLREEKERLELERVMEAAQKAGTAYHRQNSGQGSQDSQTVPSGTPSGAGMTGEKP